ncbi:hypothetical protein PR003_g26378 [Phytophthora rubi]|uniref:Uncharacterized protein n=1 Tax=Phytophthora rubi TaxID=129364 RepID=A0A6A3IG62_9STRA|nr:hypothetical protein PR002_g25806 [Phytophthora rubi]KAE8979515.1 hypothetical protein PR001_g24530 [Phytophthora rubi]KAE9286205.1 hypothetical protein PR003_g26378 [Phytophthora rubi]
MAKGSKTATPLRPTRGPTGAPSTLASDLTSRLSTFSERSVSFDDSADEGPDAKDTMMDYEDLEEKTPAAMQELDDQEGAMLSAGRSGGSRSLFRSQGSPGIPRVPAPAEQQQSSCKQGAHADA